MAMPPPRDTQPLLVCLPTPLHRTQASWEALKETLNLGGLTATPWKFSRNRVAVCPLDFSSTAPVRLLNTRSGQASNRSQNPRPHGLKSQLFLNLFLQIVYLGSY